MNNPWKLATIGLVLTGFTATASGLTTAYMLRPAAAIEQDQIATRPVARDASAPVAQRPATDVSARPAALPVTRVSTAAAPADCTSGGERAMRIAKPGAIGALLGAGLGAAGGAIADGGKSAGKGALIGGLAGAALGAGYGAYKTKNECGTVFGNGTGFAGTPTYASSTAAAPQSALRASDADRITVYSAR